jgi:toxin ParE1/3/4
LGRLRFSNRARQDLLDIWVYIAERNPRAADKVFDLIQRRCQDLREHVQLGPARPDIAVGARALVIERWLVLYRQVDDGVQVVRIVDGARDLTTLD